MNRRRKRSRRSGSNGVRPGARPSRSLRSSLRSWYSRIPLRISEKKKSSGSESKFEPVAAACSLSRSANASMVERWPAESCAATRQNCTCAGGLSILTRRSPASCGSASAFCACCHGLSIRIGVRTRSRPSSAVHGTASSEGEGDDAVLRVEGFGQPRVVRMLVHAHVARRQHGRVHRGAALPAVLEHHRDRERERRPESRRLAVPGFCSTLDSSTNMTSRSSGRAARHESRASRARLARAARGGHVLPEPQAVSASAALQSAPPFEVAEQPPQAKPEIWQRCFSL